MSGISDTQFLLTNKHYEKFHKQKLQLKEKYNVDTNITGTVPGRLYDRETHRKYLRELSDLMFKPEGDYQKFIWDFVTCETEKENMDRRARGIKQGGRRESNFNYY